VVFYKQATVLDSQLTALVKVEKNVCVVSDIMLLMTVTTITTTTTVLWPFVWDYTGEGKPVPEEAFTHSHLS